MRKKKVEILAPAGSYESMVAAVNAGADAVYIGGSRFGARAYANNLDEEAMLNAIDYVHLHGCRLYMTVNTLVKEKEFSGLYDYLNPYYRQGLDAAIIQDLGVFSYFKEHFPQLALHASTQMTITGVNGARLLKELGASRVVTARELSLEEIRQIHDQVDIEIESFVHGALCYCYSGQCLMSSLIGGRSGNRGRCAQTCRLPYEVKQGSASLNRKDEKYVLSLKDLCTLELIPDMLEAGIDSLKIEGRMKSPRYTAGVVSVYRKYVDKYLQNGREGYQVEASDRKLLLDLFDRGGFSDGYYRNHNGRHMVALKEKPAFREGNQPLFDYLDRTYVEAARQEPIKGKVCLNVGEPSSLALSAAGKEGMEIQVTGQEVQPARNQPITEEKLRTQVCKTGGTPFFFEQLETEIRGNAFLPVQALNELRRSGLEMLERKILSSYRRDAGKEEKQKADRIQVRNTHPMGITALADRKELIPRLLLVEGIERIYLDSCEIGSEEWEALASAVRNSGKECFLALPQIFRKEAEEYFLKERERFIKAGFEGCLIRSLEEISFFRKQMGYGGRFVFDSNLYAWNGQASELLKELGASEQTLPLELNARELEETGCSGKELVVYGRLPVMVSAQCINRTVSGCDRKEKVLQLKDRLGKEFPVKNHCRFCYNTIYNIAPLSLLEQKEQVCRLSPERIRLQFTLETPEQAEKIARTFVAAFAGGDSLSLPGEYTKGHFRRGVE